MAWGYWSATAIDRGRSPRRNTSMSTAPVNHNKYQPHQQHTQQQQQHQPQQHIPQQQLQKETQCPIGNSCPQAAQDAQNSTVCNSPCQSPCQQSPCGSPCRSPCRSECRSLGCRSQCHSPDFESAPPPPPPNVIQCTYSRRQSLDSPQVTFFFNYIFKIYTKVDVFLF